MPPKQDMPSDKPCKWIDFTKTAYELNGGSKGSKKYSEILKEYAPIYKVYKDDVSKGGALSAWDWLSKFISNMNLKTGITKPPPGLSVHGHRN